MSPSMVIHKGIPHDDVRAAVQIPVRHYRSVSFDDVFPTKAWLSFKYKLGFNATDEQLVAASNRHARLFRDTAAIVINQCDWNLLHQSTSTSCQFAVQALREFVPDHQVWVRHESGCFERVHHRGWTYW